MSELPISVLLSAMSERMGKLILAFAKTLPFPLLKAVSN